MQIYVFINNTKLWALLDFGFTHNFVESEAVSWVGIVFVALGCLCVTVANGDYVASSGCNHNLKTSITGEDFIIDCYGLTPRSYEMVLGV
jgi:hypothetical protein